MKNKKNIVFMVIGAITLIAVTLGATYAYFTAQSAGGANIDTNVITGTTDNLSFSFGDLINIYATEENFAQGMGNLTDNTTAQAILRANNTSNEATANYNIYLIIESNNFEYTTSDQTPEILLNVTDPNGNKVENITGLVHYEEGFDITTRTGGFLLVPDYEISATNVQTIQDWNIEVTFVNLNSDQNANTNKTLTGKLYLTQEQMSSYELTQISNIDATTTYNSIDATLDITNGSAAVSKYYYGIEKTNNTRSAETVEYVESDSSSYKFTNLEANTEYTIYSYVEDENKIKSNVYSTNITTSEYEIPKIDSVSHSVTLNSITLNATASNGSNEIVKYMYSKDNGVSWEESTSNTHTFTNLTDSTEYKIKVKVVDSEGNESTEYYEAITTEIYILPVVASVDATTTWNSITLTPTGTDGTNTIDHYEYSIDNGAYQTSNVFSNLNENTQYTIRVKAIDTAGRESNVYETKVTTDTYELPVINNVTVDSTSNSITINVNATGGDGSIVSYHYSRDDGSNYTESNNASYTFNDLTSNTTFYIKVYVTDSNGRVSSEYSTSITIKNPTLAEICTSGDNLASCIAEFNTLVGDGAEGLYYHDGTGSYANADQEAGDNSYRYAGANPNNYVCFGSDAATCPTENLFRIIGIFGNQIKLIKHEYANSNWLGNDNAYNHSSYTRNHPSSSYYKGSIDQSMVPVYYWTKSGNNNWNHSVLNTGNLNQTYLNAIGEKWSNLIATTNWQVGGNTVANIKSGSVKTVFTNEIVSPTSSITYSGKIGLMYISDYGYAATPENWNTTMETLNTNANRNNNWMFMGLWEWTITRTSDNTNSAFALLYLGNIDSYNIDNSFYAIRPCFYLNSNVTMTSGTGTQADPYRIS